jgi:hypothetical protein
VGCGCPNDRFGSAFDYYCGDCELGCYLSGDSCYYCPPGTRGDHNVIDLATCRNCNLGYFTAVSGTTQCFPATPGHYVPGSAATGETDCSPGTFQDEYGQTSCKTCRGCLQGTVVAAPCTATADTLCSCWRLGANLGYIKFTRESTINPF